jgi:uncharacterized protein YggT (Ycf19 family)
VVRGLALLAFAGALLGWGPDWAVRHRRLQPFAWWPRAVRKVADPLLSPLARTLRRAGASPADAPLWLIGVMLVAGLLADSLVGWIGGSIAMVTAMRGATLGTWLRLALGNAIGLVMALIIVRVIGSWLGVGRYTKWMRPVFLLTDWIVRPIARRLPPMGALDLSPFVAYILLLVARSLIMGMSQ